MTPTSRPDLAAAIDDELNRLYAAVTGRRRVRTRYGADDPDEASASSLAAPGAHVDDIGVLGSADLWPSR